MSEEDQEVVLRLADPPPCARCGSATLFQAEFPHSWKNASDQEVTGIRAVVLCPACDRGEPSADALLALFSVDGQLTEKNLTVFNDLATAWIDVVRSKSVDMKDLDAEHEAWRRGELDNE
ncbi:MULTISPECIES: DUF6300 family protein [unclassified Streptomyces]|uniref:DUF6300 family protein n=1 Tax=unclassified Streptomyces TaxID=2593676 RepID=UPI000AB72AA1|nr:MULTISPECIES: DUF6300 family protein [unclassified Streptomyces]